LLENRKKVVTTVIVRIDVYKVATLSIPVNSCGLAAVDDQQKAGFL
jgi:hypothetical protein